MSERGAARTPRGSARASFRPLALSALALIAGAAACRANRGAAGPADSAEGRPLEAHLASLAAQGYREVERAEHPPYRAIVLHNEGDEFGWWGPDKGSLPPYQLILSAERGGRQLVLRQWTSQGMYYYLGSPRLCRIGRDGTLALGFEQYCGGNGWGNDNLRIFELGARVREITPELPESWHASWLRDLDEDGAFELGVLVADYEFYMGHCHAASPACFRVYAWDPQRRSLRDESVRFRGFYFKDIALHRKTLVSDEDRPGDYHSGAAISILLDYWCLGELGAGWREFNRHMGQLKARASPERRKSLEAMEADLRKRLPAGGGS